MLSSLLNTDPARGSENNNDSRQTLKSQAQTEILSLVDEPPGHHSKDFTSLENMDQLSKCARQLLLNKNLELSKVRPFFWSLVEAYVDRFQIYPFDVTRALFSYMELRDYPEDEVRTLVQALEKRYLEQHGRALKQATELVTEAGSLDAEIKELRDSLKYAALLDEL
jgi:hypothetical protein